MKSKGNIGLSYKCPQCKSERSGRETFQGSPQVYTKLIFYTCGTVFQLDKKGQSYSGGFTYKCKIGNR